METCLERHEHLKENGVKVVAGDACECMAIGWNGQVGWASRVGKMSAGWGVAGSTQVMAACPNSEGRRDLD